MPVVHGRALVQPVSVEDVAEGVARAAEGWRNARMTIDLVGPDRVPLADLLGALRGWLGLAPAPALRIPSLFAWPFALCADLAGWLGWRSPLRSTTLRQLKAGVVGDGEVAQRVLGVKPHGLASMLASWPSGVQERWFARLYFLKPLAILTLALFWIASGIIGLVGRDAAAAILEGAGAPALVAMAAVIAGSLLDMALGALVLVRRRTVAALNAMLVVSLAYLVAASIFVPGLWLDPLGPLVKIVPAALLALVALAMMDER
ncbi:MAG: SDR family oxidoreductase, partial [Rhizobiales bacterium]|nr:SDR family oxidoreductase [Hyphomicrobiales bacterium]